MTVLEALILGIVQGITEFLPISSSGHLVLLQNLFGIKEGNLFFSTMLHLGTLLAVLVVFKTELFHMLRHPFNRLSLLLAFATIPTAINALIFKDAVEQAFSSTSYLGYGFLLTGIVLLGVERKPSGKKGLDEMRWQEAVFIGLAQGIAIFPAVSRSGLTIAAALYQNIDRKAAATFSFLLSIPAIVGSILFQFDGLTSLTGVNEIKTVAIGTLAATASGFMAIKLMMRVIVKKSLVGFSLYVFLLGGLLLLDQKYLKLLDN